MCIEIHSSVNQLLFAWGSTEAFLSLNVNFFMCSIVVTLLIHKIYTFFSLINLINSSNFICRELKFDYSRIKVTESKKLSYTIYM